MARVIQIGDTTYKVKVNSGGAIVLDTGINVGEVIVTGNLRVEGNTTTVNTTNLEIEDNIILLNKGETGAGITDTLNRSGIEIDRGTLPDAQFVFDENIEWTGSTNAEYNTYEGAFATRLFDNSISALRTRSIVTGNKDTNLNLLGPSPAAGESGVGSAVVSVLGVADYAERIERLIALAPGQVFPTGAQLERYNAAIPTVGWIGDKLESYFETNPPEFIKRAGSDSILQIFDSGSGDSETVLTLVLDSVISAQWRLTRYDVQDFRFSGSTLESKTAGNDLVIRAAGTGTVAIEDSLKLKYVSNPASSTNSVVLYANQETYGGTGIYFVNSENTRDEFVSRRKSIAYSMIF